MLLIEPDELLRDKVEALFSFHFYFHGLTVLATGDRASALDAVGAWRPTVAVVEPYGWHDQGDARGGVRDVVHAVTDLRAADPRLPIVLHIVKGSRPEELPAAVWDAHAVSHGRGWSVAAEVDR